MNHSIQPQPATTQDLDDASLDLVVGAGVMCPEATDGTTAARKQEHNEKLADGGQP